MQENEPSDGAILKDRSTARLVGALCSLLAVGLLLLGATAPLAAASPLPAVTELTPGYGPPTGGTAVTIRGTNFAEVTAIYFGSTEAASFAVNSETEITAVSPSGEGIVDVTVTTSEGASATNPADEFSYAPVVTKVEPNDGAEAGGTQVTITGANFTGATEVEFGTGKNATSFTVNSDTSITAVSPPEEGPYGTIVDVRVTGPGGWSARSAGDEFIYGPLVEKVEPQLGPAAGGTQVTITGSFLEEATEVRFGSIPAADFTVNSSTSITVIAPPFTSGSASVPVTVTTPRGLSTTLPVGDPGLLPENYFRYGPTVTNVEPDHGPTSGGTRVTIHGTGFASERGTDDLPFVRTVYFGSTELTCESPRSYWLRPCAPVEFEVKSETEITAVSPPGIGTVDVRIETFGGASPTSSLDLFAYSLPEGTPVLESSKNLIQLMNCRAMKQTAVKTAQRHRRKVLATDRVCTSRLTSGSVAAGGPTAARLTRGDVLYATGTATIGRANTRLALKPLRQVMPGRYRLWLASRQGPRHETIAIR